MYIQYALTTLSPVSLIAKSVNPDIGEVIVGGEPGSRPVVAGVG
jgi:hypothetical protein